MDEAVSIHEHIGKLSDSLLPDGDRRETVFRYTGIWMIVVGVPFIVVFSILACSIAKCFESRPGSFGKFVGGMIVFLIGALGFEFLSNLFAYHSNSRILVTNVEEVWEMIGATTILWSLYDLAEIDKVD